MKKTTLSIIASLIACSSLFSAATQADPHGPQWQQQGGGQHDDRGRGPQGHEQGRGGSDRHSGGHHEGGRDHFAWNGHDFRRGHPMPQEYRGPHYRVDDWRERDLPAPPRGQYWSYIDGNYVLIAAATGVITSLILNSAFH